MVAFSGRVESKIVVPTGGASISAATSAHTSAVTITVPAGVYYLTEAGGVDSLIDTLEALLNTHAPPSSGAWTVSLSTTTGRVTIACTEPAYIQFTSTALRDIIGFEYNFDHPTSAAQLALWLGQGTWTNGAGYLFNESSGNLASAFGLPASLTATSLTYSTLGPRGGADKAIGFDASGDNANGGNVFNVTAVDDLAIVWVGKVASTAGTVDWFGKWSGGNPRWLIYKNAGTLVFNVNDGTDNADATCTFTTTNWHVGIAVFDRSTNQTRIGVHDLTTGTQSIGTAANVAAVGTLSNAASFVIGSQVFGADTNLKLAALYVTYGNVVASGLSTNISSALTAFAAAMKSQTGTECAEGVWIPDCPLNLEGDPAQAPRVSDLRTTRGPTGVVLGLSGNSFYRHRGLIYELVPRSQVWESAATYANGSWEHWFKTTQMGFGHEWFTPASPVQVYWSNAGTDALLGGDFNDGVGVSGWSIVGLDSIEPRKAKGSSWTGYWTIEIPELISSG